MKKGQTARNRLSHLICPRRFHAEAGFGTWSPVTALAGRGGCRGFIGPVPLPLSIRLTVNIATTRPGVKRFSTMISELGSENYAKVASAIEKTAECPGKGTILKRFGRNTFFGPIAPISCGCERETWVIYCCLHSSGVPDGS